MKPQRKTKTLTTIITCILYIRVFIYILIHIISLIFLNKHFKVKQTTTKTGTGAISEKRIYSKMANGVFSHKRINIVNRNPTPTHIDKNINKSIINNSHTKYCKDQHHQYNQIYLSKNSTIQVSFY